MNRFPFRPRLSYQSPQQLAKEGLNEILSQFEFDVVEELKAFRQWTKEADRAEAFAQSEADTLREVLDCLAQSSSNSDRAPISSSHRTPHLVSDSPQDHLNTPDPSTLVSSHMSYSESDLSEQSAPNTATRAEAPVEQPQELASVGQTRPHPGPSWSEETSSTGWQGNVFPWMAVLGLGAACAGIGLAFSWLTTPPQPPELADATASSVALLADGHRIPLEELPLVPLSATSTNGKPADAAIAALIGEEELLPSDNLSDSDDGDLEDSDLDDETTSEEGEDTGLAPVATAGDVLDPNSDLGLGPDLGAGVFLVLLTYQDESSLTQAREVAGDAFVKEVNGETYIQIAAFDQLEYARHLADTLRDRGLPALVVQ